MIKFGWVEMLVAIRPSMNQRWNISIAFLIWALIDYNGLWATMMSCMIICIISLNVRGRNTFYSTYFDGICLLVLNTNLFHMHPGDPPQKNCAEKQAQLDLIKTVCDTIKEADHLVVLHHFGLLNELKKDNNGKIMKVFNANIMNIRATCDPASDFTKVVYPWLEAVQNRQTQVTLIGGDFGMKAKEFAYTTKAGIKILGSGINNSMNPKYAPEYVTNFDPDKVLILRHFPKIGKLDWDFKVLNDMVETSKEKIK